MHFALQNISALRDAHEHHISNERVSAASQVGSRVLSHTCTDMLIHIQFQYYDKTVQSRWLGLFS